MLRRHLQRRIARSTWFSVIGAGCISFFWIWGDGCWWPRPIDPVLYVGAERGAAGIVWRTGAPLDPGAFGWMIELAASAPRTAEWRPLYRSFDAPGACCHAVWVPLWVLWLGLLMPAAWFVRGDRRARRSAALAVRCVLRRRAHM